MHYSLRNQIQEAFSDSASPEEEQIVADVDRGFQSILGSKVEETLEKGCKKKKPVAKAAGKKDMMDEEGMEGKPDPDMMEEDAEGMKDKKKPCKKEDLPAVRAFDLNPPPIEE